MHALLRRSTRPGCERGDGRSPSQLPTQSVDNSVRSLGATAAGPRHDRLRGNSFKKWTTPTGWSQKGCSCGAKPHHYGAAASLIRKKVDWFTDRRKEIGRAHV